MLKHFKGDIFKSDATAILHQVNCQGVMGSGVAKQVREKYPHVYRYYKAWCDDKHMNPKIDFHKSPLLGRIQVVYTEEFRAGEKPATVQAIVNLFAQDKYGRGGKCYTDYEALKSCLQQVNKLFRGMTVAIPYLMSCSRGGGDWNIVSRIIEETLTDCDVTLYEYSGE